MIRGLGNFTSINGTINRILACYCMIRIRLFLAPGGEHAKETIPASSFAAWWQGNAFAVNGRGPELPAVRRLRARSIVRVGIW